MRATTPFSALGFATRTTAKTVPKGVFESSFLTILFEDTNIAYIFYKSSRTCGTKTNDDTLLETEGVFH
jgi:hypothetical protein